MGVSMTQNNGNGNAFIYSIFYSYILIVIVRFEIHLLDSLSSCLFVESRIKKSFVYYRCGIGSRSILVNS